MERDKIEERDSFDIESFMREDDGMLVPPVQAHAPSSSIFTRLEESYIFQNLLGYPAPNTLKLRPTSWLDGVRGVAALLVYIFHSMSCWVGVVPAWHADDKQTSILQLPLIRSIFVAGGTAVCLFFALSGYVLTYKSLQSMRAGSRQQVYPAVASSMFRRGFRLYLPPILLTFCEMLATRAGYAPPLNFTFVPEATFLSQFTDWLYETNRLSNPLHNFIPAIQGFVVHPKYDPVIWTIPLEFYGSFVCYLLLLLFARVPSNTTRMSMIATFSLLSMVLGSWNNFCFSAGMFIADFNLHQDENKSTPRFRTPNNRKLLSVLAAIAFYVAGMPTLMYPEAKTNPMFGYETLRSLVPMGLHMEDHARFWWSISGVTLLFCISQLPGLKRVFETNMCQYLGRLAFSLYLVHQFCLVLFGFMMQGFVLGLAGLKKDDGGLVYWVLCAVWYVLFSGPVFAIAALVEKWVDAKSVVFARWLETKALKVYKGSS